MEEAKVTQEEAETAKEDEGREAFEETTENPEGEETSETSEEETSEETSKEENQESSKETPDKALEEKNKKLYARAKKAEDKLKEHEKVSKPATGDPMEAVRLGKALADTSEEEAEVIVTYAKGKFNTLTPTPEQIIQASKDEWITTAIEAKRLKVAGENKTPEPSSPSSVLGGKTEEDLEKMDNKKFAKWFKGETKGRRIGT